MSRLSLAQQLAAILFLVVSLVAHGADTLILTGSSPVDNATNVAPAASVTLTFSVSLNARTVTSNTVTLRDAGGVSVPVTFAVSGSQFSMTPVNTLLPRIRYQVTVSTGVRGIGGEMLAATEVRVFTTAMGIWSGARLVEPSFGNATRAELVADGNGNALLLSTIKISDALPDTYIYTTAYRAGHWETPYYHALFTEIPRGFYPQIAMDASGNALVVWPEDETTVFTNRYRAGAAHLGWIGPAYRFVAPLTQPAVAMDGHGMGWVVGLSTVRRPERYPMVYRFNGTEWNDSHLIDGIPNQVYTPYLVWPQVVMDGRGNALAVWTQGSDAKTPVQLRTAWLHVDRNIDVFERGQPQGRVESFLSSPKFAPKIAIDANSNGWVTWLGAGPVDGGAIQSRRYSDQLRQWSAPMTIARVTPETTILNSDARMAMALDSSGNPIVVWFKEQPDRGHALLSSRYLGNETWEQPRFVEPYVAGDHAADPRVAVDRSGNVMAVWRRSRGTEGTSHIFASWLTATGWSTAEQISNDIDEATDARIAFDSTGAWVIWRQRWKTDPDSFHLWGNRFE